MKQPTYTRIFLPMTMLVPVFVYLWTMAPSVYFGDSGELNTASFVLGLAHVPGYPLYCIVGKLFTFLPVGSVAFRLNFMSIAFTIAALGLMYVLCKRLTGNSTAALFATLLLAFTFTLWEQSLKSRAYPMNLFFGLFILWSAVRWREGEGNRFLYLATFFFGLGMGNHEILLITIMPLAVLAFGRIQKTGLAPFAIAGAFFLLGASVYLYLPLRSIANPMLDWGDPETVRRLLDVLLQKQYAHKILSPELGPKVEMAGLILRSFALEFVWLPLVVGLLGMYAMAKKIPALLVGLVLMVLANIALRINYIGDFEFSQIYRYLINSYAAAAICMAFGMQTILTFLETRTSPVRANALGLVLVIVLASLPLFAHLQKNDLHRHWMAHQFARGMLQSPEEGALLFVGGDNDIYPIWDNQYIGRYRQDVVAMGKPGFGADWLRKEYAVRTDPSWFAPRRDMAGYDGPSKAFHTFFANAVDSARFPVYAMFNDAEDPIESKRWKWLRERFDWRPETLSIAFAAKGRWDLFRETKSEPAWKTLPLDSLFDKGLPRDAHTIEVVEIYTGLFLRHGLNASSRKNPSLAASQFARALRADPMHLEAAVNLASSLARLGRLDDAEELLVELSQDKRADWRVWYNLGKVRKSLGDPKGAAQAFGQALSMDPGNQKILKELRVKKPSAEEAGEQVH